MHMLVERAFKTNGLVQDCSVVKAKSDEYRISQDYIAQFIAEKIVSQEGGKIQKRELSTALPNGFKIHIPRVLHLQKNYLQSLKKYGAYTRYWKGCAIKQEEIDDDTFDIVE